MGRVVAHKGIKIEYEPNEDMQTLIDTYSQVVQEFLSISFNNEITSMGRLNEYSTQNQ